MNPEHLRSFRMHAWVGGEAYALPDQFDDLDACYREALGVAKMMEEPIAARYRQYAAICAQIKRIVEVLRTTSPEKP